MIDLTNPGSLFTVGLYGCETLTDDDKSLLETIRPSGIILFQRNIVSKEQVFRLIGEVEEFLGYHPLVAIDQEGGIVTRLHEGFTVAPGAMALARTGDPCSAHDAGRILGREMKALGIDWDLAPVVDINNNRDNPGIGVRSFGETREVVTLFAGEFARGLREEGILACLKHFPGKGRVAVDAHLDMPELDAEEEILFADELYPYENIEAPSWMPSHVYYPALQSVREPASVSREVLTGLVRDRLGYGGVLISDDMTMGGVTKFYSVSQGVRKSFYAGMDSLLVCHDREKQLESFRTVKEEVERSEKARNRMEESLGRINHLFTLTGEGRPPLCEIGGDVNLSRMKQIVVKSIETLKKRDWDLPLDSVDRIITMTATRQVQVEDSKSPVLPLAERLALYYQVPLTVLEKDEEHMTVESVKGESILVFTENAHLNRNIAGIIKKYSQNSRKMLLCALRNPYDCDMEGVNDGICSYGYTPLQQEELFSLLTEKDRGDI